jgi:outer membrane protein assembly factor BamB
MHIKEIELMKTSAKQGRFVTSAFWVLLFFSAGVLCAQDWPMTNGNPQRTSRGAALTPQPPLTMTAEIIDANAATCVVYRGALFVGRAGKPNSFAAFNTTTGEELWSFDVPDSRAGVDHVPAISGDLVLCSGQKATALYALNRLTGEVVWTVPTGSLYSRNVVTDGETAFVCADSLLCMRLADGSVRWKYPHSPQTTPALDDDAVYVNGNYLLVAIDKTTGQEKWNIASAERAFGHVIVDGDVLYVSDKTAVRAVDKSDGTILWNYPILDVTAISQLTTGCLALGADILCVGVWEDTLSGSHLYALNKTTGAQVWWHPFPTQGLFTPTVVGNTVYAVSWRDGTLWGFDITNGDVTCKIEDQSYSEQPVAADGKLYVSFGSSVRVFGETGTSVAASNLQPVSMELSLAPNPAANYVALQLTLQHREAVTVSVYDVLGRHVQLLADQVYEAGVHQITWNAHETTAVGLVSGIYYISAWTSSQFITKPVLLRR